MNIYTRMGLKITLKLAVSNYWTSPLDKMENQLSRHADLFHT
ncbi:hypothetical protein ACFPFV_09660 [Salinicoccus siamensis]